MTGIVSKRTTCQSLTIPTGSDSRGRIAQEPTGRSHPRIKRGATGVRAGRRSNSATLRFSPVTPTACAWFVKARTPLFLNNKGQRNVCLKDRSVRASVVYLSTFENFVSEPSYSDPTKHGYSRSRTSWPRHEFCKHARSRRPYQRLPNEINKTVGHLGRLCT